MEIGTYNVHASPIKTEMPELLMDTAELKRLCQEQRIPLYYTNVSIVEHFPGITEEVKPYTKYYAFINGVRLTANDRPPQKQEGAV